MVGVFLAIVPTAFSMFPGMLSWRFGIRLGLLAVWTLAACLTVLAASVHEDAVLQISEARRAQLRNLRRIAVAEVLESYLRSGTKGFPAQYTFTAYLYDDDQELLVPFWPVWDPVDGDDTRIFEQGKGATGYAWNEERSFVVTGDAVAGERYGLTDEQQQIYKDFKVAAATPILEDGNQPFGVLTALGKADDQFFTDGGLGLANLREMADVVGVVLKAIPEPEDLR
jgi:hypothetical protein